MEYYILIVGRGLISLLFAVVCVIALLLFIRSYKKFVFTDIIAALRPSAVKGKWALALATVFFCIIYGLITAVNMSRTAAVSIALTYPEASQGLNPNGSRYNMSSILSDEVLERAIAFGGLQGATVENLQASLDIQPANGVGFGGTVSTQFILSFTDVGKTEKLNGKEIVFSVASAYKEWFIEKYSVNDSALEITFDDIENYDYPDLADYFGNAITSICNFASVYREKNDTFRSAETGETFSSLEAKGWDIYNTGMESLNSYILSKGLSKDKEGYLSRLRYNYTNNCNDYRSNIQSYDVRIEAINKYDNDMATVVYIPTYDTDDTFYMSKTKIGIDHFSADADEHSGRASNILSVILDEKYLMQQLRENADSMDAYSKADEMISELSEEIIELSEKTRATVQEFVDTTYNGYMSVTEPVSYGLGYMVFAVAGRGLLFMAVIYVIRALWFLEKSGRKNGERGGI